MLAFPTTYDMPVGAPQWWLRRLGSRLISRRHGLQRLDDYYNGIQPLAFMSDVERAQFLRRFPSSFSMNFMSLVVDAERERLVVEGFRFGDVKTNDDDAWRFWQENELDAESQVAHTEALIKGVAYALVWPRDDGGVGVTIEDPLEMIVDVANDNRRKRRAALKVWLDDDDHHLATLYLPNAIYKYRSVRRAVEFSTDQWGDLRLWEERAPDGEPWPLPNPIGLVPVVAIPNRPRLLGEGQSEIAPVLSMQDAINKYRADAMVSSEFNAYRQRYLMNYDAPVDPETGEPSLNLRPGQDRLWFLPVTADPDNPNAPSAQIGEFGISPLETFYAGIDREIQGIASASRTPYHYFLQHGGQPPSGESLRSAETGLVKKVRAFQIHGGEAWEEVVRLQFLFNEDTRGLIRDAETIWRDPESRTESEHVDALTKLKSLGIPDEQLWADAGYSPQQVSRFRREKAANALLTSLANPAPLQLAPGQPVAPVTTPPPVTNAQPA